MAIRRTVLPRCRRLLPWLLLLWWSSGVHAADSVLFREDFHHLDDWEPYYFSGIERHTLYETEVRDGTQVLVAASDGSASALISKQRFSVEKYPIIQWRWKVDNLYARGNYRLKSGDDYPIRVYIVFAYDPETAPFGMKIKYEFAKALYGQYPPHSSVNYIWANRPDEQETVTSPYTDRSVMIPLQFGAQNVGRWVEETVNIFEDYQKAFGKPPPPVASVAIMNDSDNTGERSTSYLDFIEIRQR